MPRGRCQRGRGWAVAVAAAASVVSVASVAGCERHPARAAAPVVPPPRATSTTSTSSAALPAPPPGLRLHVQRLFTLALPPAFERVRHEDSGLADARAGANLARFEDGRGRWLVVSFDEAGTGFSADAVWHLAPDASGRGLELVAEEPPCRRTVFETSEQAAGEEYDECPAGDGRLSIAATAELAGHRYAFFFGDAAHEEGVDLEPFRAALRSFRAR